METISATLSLSLVADRLEAWAEHAEKRNGEPFAEAIYGDSEKNKAENYRMQVKHIRESRDRIQAAMEAAVFELSTMHRHYHPECSDSGPDSCPTWNVIYKVKEAAGIQ